VKRPIASRHLSHLATLALGTALLRKSLSSRAGSREFYTSTFGVAGTWLAGGLATGPVPLASEQTRRHAARELLVVPVAVGSGMFALFYLAALAASRIPQLDKALTSVLMYADEGSTPLVLSTTLANAVAEEVFFRGALYPATETATDPHRGVAVTTAAYVLSTTATRNPALVVASAVMGTVFAVQRRTTGGVLAPVVTHVTWSALMLRFLPPLFPHPTLKEEVAGR
jgi:membrane protease YdiL (CAAX protease family)